MFHTFALFIGGLLAVAPPASADGVTVQSMGQVEPEEVPVVDEPTPAQPVGPLTDDEHLDPERLQYHLTDPMFEQPRTQDLLAGEPDKAERSYLETLHQRVAGVERPNKLPLTLQEAIQRAMANNLAVRVVSYNPAIETTKIVEAEAAFDVSFFTNLIKNKQNQPTASALVGSNVDTFSVQGGLTKLLPTGMRATTSLDSVRNSNDFQFQTLNPQWNSAFVVELRQPWLRGFGIDFNRTSIHLAKLDHRISEEQFRAQVIETLVDVEQAYWDLVTARRDVVITARLLSRFEQIYEYLWQRREFDAYKIQIAETKARLETTKAAFIQVVANVRNAEDVLVARMNDPEIDLADDVEILPLDFPTLAPVVLDRLSEVQVALDHRTELAEAKLRIKQAKIGVGQAKNQALPQLDMTFRYTVDGLGPSAHDAFSEVTKNDFHEYYISLEFEIPMGNRAARARERRASLLHAQSIANLEAALENVILDVNLRVRQVQTDYDQILPSYVSAQASEDQYEAIRARAESRNFIQLNQELNALQALASARRTLMRALVDYSMAFVELERAKGTLPEYNAVILPQAEE